MRRSTIESLVRVLQAQIAIAIVGVILAGCRANNPTGNASHTDAELDSDGLKNTLRVSPQTWSSSSDQPQTYAEADKDGVTGLLPGPANAQSLNLASQLVSLSSVNPATTTMRGLDIEFGDETVTAIVPVETVDPETGETVITTQEVAHQSLVRIQIAEYTTETTSVVDAEARRLSVLQQYWSTATEAQLAAFKEEVAALESITVAGLEAATRAAGIIVPAFTGGNDPVPTPDEE